MYTEQEILDALFGYINKTSDDDLANGVYPVKIDIAGTRRDYEIHTINAADIFSVIVEREYAGSEYVEAFKVQVMQPEKLDDILAVMKLMKV